MWERLSKITFISSESCNLNCSYCEISKNKSEFHLQEAEKVRKALVSGEYVTRYMHIFNKFNLDPTHIKNIELWGQEPTLTLSEFTSQLYRILNWLPNCEHLFFSTNGVAHSNKIIDLIDTLNNYLKQNPNRKFDVIIQFSFDGEQYTKQQRGIDPQFIINNIKKTIIGFNNIDITSNLLINCQVHGVMTPLIMKEQLNDKYNTYWENNDTLMNELYQLNTNPQVNIRLYTAFLQAPYNATKEEGQLLCDYAKFTLKMLNEPYKISHISAASPFFLIGRAINALDNKIETTEGIIEHIYDNFNFNYGDISSNNFIGYYYGCGPGDWDIKMRYDGSLIYCQNVIFGLNPQNFIDKKGINYDIQKYELNHSSFQPNLLTSKKEDIEKFINLFQTDDYYTLHFMISNIINLMYLLLQNNQIDESYKKDHEKILRHALYLSLGIQCFYNNVIDTGSLYAQTLGMIRFYCNGALDVIEKYSHEWSYIGGWN